MTGFAAALLGAFNLTTPAGGETGTPRSALNFYGSSAGAGYGDGTSDNTDLHAFVTILLFDKNYNFLDVAYQQVTSDNTWHPISASYTVKEAGYAFVYASHEDQNSGDVYFDDVTTTYTPTNVVQYNEYYPYGLQTAQSWTRTGSSNNFLYDGGNTLNSTSGLYDLAFRNYDPALGRFFQVDPMALSSHSLTPYHYAADNPMTLNDPTGLIAETSFWALVTRFLAQGGGHWSDSEDAGVPSATDIKAILGDASGGGTEDIGNVSISYTNEDGSMTGIYFSGNPQDGYSAQVVTGEQSEFGDMVNSNDIGEIYEFSSADLKGSQGIPELNNGTEISKEMTFPYNGVGLSMTIIGAGVQPLKTEFRSLLNVASKSSIKGVAFGGKLLGIAGFGLTAYQFGSKLFDPKQQLTTNDYMDFGVGASTFVAGLLIANPVGVAALIGVGVAYGVYTIWRDNGN